MLEQASLVHNCLDGGTDGSGHNMLIGENGTGKTSILEAVTFLTPPKYSSENKLTINEYYDHGEPIKILGDTDIFQCKSSIDFNNTQTNKLHFNATGIAFEAKPRDRKEANKFLSSPFAIKNHFHVDSEKYFRGDEPRGDIDFRDKSFLKVEFKKAG